MSEPTINLPREGESLLLHVVVVDTHWRDKGLYKVKIRTQKGDIEVFVRAGDLREVEE